MNIEMISLALSVLGSVPMIQDKPPVMHQAMVYASWHSTGTAGVPCPDPSTGLDPYGTPVVISHTQTACEKGECDSVTALKVVTLYPEPIVCMAPFDYVNHRLFASAQVADAFLRSCKPSECLDWQTREATDAEVVASLLEQHHWNIQHVPGGDDYKYPDGIYQVWPIAERTFEEPLGMGSTAIQAVKAALGETSL